MRAAQPIDWVKSIRDLLMYMLMWIITSGWPIKCYLIYRYITSEIYGPRGSHI